MRSAVRMAAPLLLGLALGMSLEGCATRMAAAPVALTGSETIAFGRISAVLTGPTTRAYLPEVRFFELVNHESRERFRVEVRAADAALVLSLPPGTYELSRIMINEGAFQAMANPGPSFHLEGDTVTYVGTWTFGIATPTYDRKITLTVSDELGETADGLTARYPSLSGRSITSRLPTPGSSVTRLYETDPYPLFWWFRRHHTT